MRPFTPETLALHWGCSPRHVRGLCKDGKLRHFRVGVLIRIPVEIVEEYEKCQMYGLSNTGGNGAPHGQGQTGHSVGHSGSSLPLIVAPLNAP